MHYYPVLLDLTGRRCVVVGGGAVAEAKVGPLVAAGAHVTVIAPALAPALVAQHRAGRFAHLARAYAPGDLAGAFLVIAATGDPTVNHAVHAEAEAVGALINVVDDPPYCGFILPSVLRRGDLIVAVSTSGKAPALAVRIRERLEREFGDEYARFLELAGRLRGPLARQVPELDRRKRLWYRLVDADVLPLLRAGDDARARARMVEIVGTDLGAELGVELGVQLGGALGGALGVGADLPAARGDAAPAALAAPQGAVYLVGAGPGDPGLITARGLELLRRADVVVYDRLVSPRLLNEARPDAVRVYVGKVPGGPCLTQEGINALLVEQARRGRTVVRLKGGDPFVFGRGVEEMLACRAAGVPCDVVPGVSSILGVTAGAGVPVTARGVSGAFAVVTGHRAGEAPGDAHEPDWAALARVDTLVVLMGVERLPQIAERLREHGRALATPVAIIENGTLPDERVVLGTLADIAARAQAAGVRAPATIVIGEVVRLRERLRSDAQEWGRNDESASAPTDGRAEEPATAHQGGRYVA